MDGRTGTPLTPHYTRDPVVVVVAAVGANPSAGSFGFAFVGAPPTTGLARGLFMLTIAQNLFQGEEKKTKKGKNKKGWPFTLPHCYDALKHDEKWKPREGANEESNTHKQTIDLDDDEEEASSDGGKRSPTPNLVAYSKPKDQMEARKTQKKRRRGKEMMS
ncbi:UDP-glycosyltransferase 73C6 [Hordeum vulgare]|nr:UDP-glycosyltransferase 73C6 [Hordeum vulgare]